MLVEEANIMKIKLMGKKTGKDFQQNLLKQYLFLCETADRVTDRRQNANKFYLAVNSLIFAVAGYLSTLDVKMTPILISVLGVTVSFIWFLHINSFKKLNSAKYEVIQEIETHLPAKIYQKEEEYLKQGYRKLTSVEKGIPFLFMGLYVLIVLVVLLLPVIWKGT